MQKRDIGVENVALGRQEHPIKRYLLITIGIAKAYSGARWRQLDAAVGDAKAVRDVLVSEYGFEVEAELYEEAATRKGILQALRTYAESSQTTDALVVYFAGHGHLDPLTSSGSWIPSDRSDDETNWVENDSVKRVIGGMKAHHVLLLSDSCFSGDYFRSFSSVIPEVGENTTRLACERTAREAITSGGLEPVVDSGLSGKSPYAHWMLRALQENTKPYLLSSELFQRILGGVTLNAQQLPRYGPLRDAGSEEGGQFVFRKTVVGKTGAARIQDKLQGGGGNAVEGPLSGIPDAFENAMANVASASQLKEEAATKELRIEEKKRLSQEAFKQRFENDYAAFLKLYDSDTNNDELFEVWRAFLERWPVAGADSSRVVQLCWRDDGVSVDTPVEGFNWSLRLPGGVTLDMIWVKPGSFQMGSPKSEKGRSKDERLHDVMITKGYWLAETPYLYCQHVGMRRLFEMVKGGPDLHRCNGVGEERLPYPACWYDSSKYCNSVDEMLRLLGLYNLGFEFGLPTEAQWEYACRAGTLSATYAGDLSLTKKNSIAPELNAIAWYHGNFDIYKHHGAPKVGAKKPNAWGFYDMVGSVYEHCLDFYHYYSYGETQVDPVFLLPREKFFFDRLTNDWRVARGGSYNCVARGCRSASRYKFSTTYFPSFGAMGFRPCLRQRIDG